MKLTELDNINAGKTGDSLVYVVNDPAGTPESGKVTVDELFEDRISGTIDTGMVAFGSATNVLNGDMNLTITTSATDFKLNLGTAGCYISAGEASTPGLFENLNMQAVEYISMTTVAGGINISAGNTATVLQGLTFTNPASEIILYPESDISTLKIKTKDSPGGSYSNTITTGEASGGGSGNLILSTGTASGSRGEIVLDAPVNASSNNITNAGNIEGSFLKTSGQLFVGTYIEDGTNIACVDISNRCLYDATGGLQTLNWSAQQAAIADTTGVTPTTDEDVEARAAIDLIIAALRAYKIIAT